MARPLRLCFEDAVYHVMARGNRKEDVFYSADDKKTFLDRINETLTKYSVICYAYCLMNNHYHLFIRTRLPNLSQAMHYLNSSYANWFKARHQIIGVIFQGRYKSILVEENRYALILSAYMHLNPIRAGLVRSLDQYPWSSYLDHIGARKPVIERLDTSLALTLAAGRVEPAPSPKREQTASWPQAAYGMYKNYVMTMNKTKNPLEEAYKGIILGGPEFIEKMERRIASLGTCREIPATDVRPPHLLTPEDLVVIMTDSLGIKKATIFRRSGGQRRNTYFQLFLYLLRKITPLSLKEIGGLVDMDYAAVHQVVKRFGLKLGLDPEIMAIKDKVERGLAETVCGGMK